MLRAALLLSVLPLAATAQDAPGAEAVFEALRLPAMMDVIAAEGVASSEDLADSLFGEGPVPASWTETVDGLYDPEAMREAALGALEAALAGEDTAAMLLFLEGETGRELASLELAAREALLDEAVEEAAREAAAVAVADESPRLALLRRYAEANDLVETNVVSALNTNLAYAQGLREGGALDPSVTEDDVLADVWSQEPQVRVEATEWLYSFLLMAYGPASDADIEALIDFSATEPGRALNRAVFATFDGLFEGISRGMGQASARYMVTEEL